MRARRPGSGPKIAKRFGPAAAAAAAEDEDEDEDDEEDEGAAVTVEATGAGAGPPPGARVDMGVCYGREERDGRGESP